MCPNMFRSHKLLPQLHARWLFALCRRTFGNFSMLVSSESGIAFVTPGLVRDVLHPRVDETRRAHKVSMGDSESTSGVFTPSVAFPVVAGAAVIGARNKRSRKTAQKCSLKTTIPSGATTTTTTTVVTTTTTTVTDPDSEKPSKLNIAIIGYGNVGKTFVSQLLKCRENLKENFGIGTEVVALARSTKMALFPADSYSMAKSEGKWTQEGEQLVFKDLVKKSKSDKESTSPTPEGDVELKKISEHLEELSSADGAKGVLIDTTNSTKVVDLYAGFLDKGIHIVTRNTAYGTGTAKRHEEIVAAGKKSGAQLHIEETLGAGMPIISKLQGLVRAGDNIKSIKIYSDTPAYVFKTWQPGRKVSEVVAEARKFGFDRGDPKNYLSCRDLRRMMTILARAVGATMKVGMVKTEFLLPEQLWSFVPPPGVSRGTAFMEELAKYDNEIGAKLQSAHDLGKVLRFVGHIDIAGGKSTIGLEMVDKNGTYGYTRFPNNLYKIDTEFCEGEPILIENRATASVAFQAAGMLDGVTRVMQTVK